MQQLSERKEVYFHNVANIFPLMSGEEFDNLKEDIRINGLLEPVWLHPDGSIIDGRNRYKACRELGITPEFRTWDEQGSLVNFVVSLNLHRRHLTQGQRAMIAVDLLPLLEKEARERQLSTLKQNSTVPEIFPERYDEQGDSRDIAASLVGTNNRYVSDAKRIQGEEPRLAEMVRNGEINIPTAKSVLSSPTEERERIISSGVQYVIESAQEIRNGKKPHVSNNSGNNEWYTPKEFIDAARTVMGSIDLDPSSSAEANKVVCASKFYSMENDGLLCEWSGSVWMNPPYSTDLIGKFCEKIASEYTDGSVSAAIALVNNATETAWFNCLVGASSAICFPNRRIKFWKPNGETGSPLQGQAIVYMGDDPDLFVEEFSFFGWCAWL